MITAASRVPNWSEIKTAYQVGKLKTVSAAARQLGVHRATVIRHIDTLEAALGEKLFHRHGKGYFPTETGNELIQVAETVDLELNKFAYRSASYTDELIGELHFTTREVANALILPILAEFQCAHPTLSVRYSPTPSRLRLEYGEADIALRIGDKEEGSNYVCEHFLDLDFGLYATATYIARHGVPDVNDLDQHRFLCFAPKEPTLPLHVFLQKHVPEERIVFRSDSPLVLDAALNLHMGIGFVPAHFAKRRDDLVPIWQPWPNWAAPIWFVIHRSIYHSRKVQSFLTFARNCKQDSSTGSTLATRE